MLQIYHCPKSNAFGGKIIISREFFNPITKDYLQIEAHEIGLNQEDGKHGEFVVAFWVPDGNDGDHGFGGSLHHVVERMQSYSPSPNFIEMKIPNECWG